MHFYRKITQKLIFSLLLTIIFFISVQSKDLFLLMGQSNMAGARQPEEQDKGKIENVYLINDKAQLEPAENPLARYGCGSAQPCPSRGGLGPGYTFAKQMTEYFPQKEFVLVVMAWTNSNVWKFGDKEVMGKGTSNAYYSMIVDRVKKTLENCKDCELKGILWHQGENQSANPNKYPKLFAQVIESHRQAYGIPDLPVVMGELGYWKDGYRFMNDNIFTKIQDSLKQVAVVSAKGLTNFKRCTKTASSDAKDGFHFDCESQREFGRRFAEKVKEFVYNDAKVKRHDPPISFRNYKTLNNHSTNFYNINGKHLNKSYPKKNAIVIGMPNNKSRLIKFFK